MKHTFSWNSDSFVLVQQWKTSTLAGLVAAMLTSCALSIIYEWLRMYLRIWDNTSHVICKGNWFGRLTLRSLRSAWHALSASVSYIIMLLLMTYNVWVLMSCLLGSAIGYLLLAPFMLAMSPRAPAGKRKEKPLIDISTSPAHCLSRETTNGRAEPGKGNNSNATCSVPASVVVNGDDIDVTSSLLPNYLSLSEGHEALARMKETII